MLKNIKDVLSACLPCIVALVVCFLPTIIDVSEEQHVTLALSILMLYAVALTLFKVRDVSMCSLLDVKNELLSQHENLEKVRLEYITALKDQISILEQRGAQFEVLIASLEAEVEEGEL